MCVCVPGQSLIFPSLSLPEDGGVPGSLADSQVLRLLQVLGASLI